MIVGSLFAGIGGFDLGFERAGFEIRWQVEIDDYCTAVLAKHWPDVRRYRDVRTVGRHNLEPVDALIGGFPCQDISDAGARAGIDGARSGLWREYARLIGELRPRVAVVENVRGLLVRGLDRVCGDLAALGYDAEWTVVRASDVGAPHKRARVFLVAYASRGGFGEQQGTGDARDGGHLDGGRTAVADAVSTGPRIAREVDAGRKRGGVRDAAGARGVTGLADADRGRQQGERLAEPGGLEGASRREPDGRRHDGEQLDAAGMADTSGARLEGRALLGDDMGEECEAVERGGVACGGLADAAGVSRTGRDGTADMAAARYGGAWHGWPARPGELQAGWEPPRVLRRAESGVGDVSDGIPSGLVRHRRRALAALGNAIVPQVAELVAWHVRARLETETD